MAPGAPTLEAGLVRGLGRGAWKLLYRVLHRLEATWPVRGYRAADAGDVATVIAFNGLVALVPTTLLLVSVAGLLLRQDRVLTTAIEAISWALPRADARDALDVLLTARRQSAGVGLLSLVGFAWVGSSFVGALARGMNRVYGVTDRRFVHRRLWAFAVVLVFAVLFLGATLAATVPTLFVGRQLDAYFGTWALAARTGQFVSYGLALLAATLLFLVLYRIVPNAGQHLADVWPGALTAALSFVGLSQAFPLYLRLVDGANRYGTIFGLIWLLVSWFYVLAHVLLFGAYVNATYLHRRRGRRPAIFTLRPAPLREEIPSGGTPLGEAKGREPAGLFLYTSPQHPTYRVVRPVADGDQSDRGRGVGRRRRRLTRRHLRD